MAVVCGPKGAGKSTLARLLVNALQGATSGAVGFLDVDCGAPELTPPGLLSLSLLTRPLLGPPACRLSCGETPQPRECRFVGDTSPAADPGAYAAAVAALLQAWAAQPEAHGAVPAPLVINTLGWVRGLGLELLCELLRGCGPTHVLQLRVPSAGSACGLPRGLFWSTLADSVVTPTLCCVLEIAAAEPGGGEARHRDHDTSPPGSTR